jgi:hypothetical protein
MLLPSLYPHDQSLQAPGRGRLCTSPRAFPSTTSTCWLSGLYGSAYTALYVVDISSEEASPPKLIEFPGATEKAEDTAITIATFSRDVNSPHLFYCTMNGYGDFGSIVTFDLDTGSVTHVTTPGAGIQAIRPILWETKSLAVTTDNIIFTANVEGWTSLFVMPLSGTHKNTVIEVKIDWEGGWLTFHPNDRNGKPNEMTLGLTSYRSRGRITYLDIAPLLSNVKRDENGDAYVLASVSSFAQAAPPIVPNEVAPKLIKYKSFDGLEVPAIYYHPAGQSQTPVVIHIHGGPESQATANYRTSVSREFLHYRRLTIICRPTHSYLLNELKVAVIYPNVRGSSGYGKKYMAADDVRKREDSVKYSAYTHFMGTDTHVSSGISERCLTTSHPACRMN